MSLLRSYKVGVGYLKCPWYWLQRGSHPFCFISPPPWRYIAPKSGPVRAEGFPKKHFSSHFKPDEKCMQLRSWWPWGVGPWGLDFQKAHIKCDKNMYLRYVTKNQPGKVIWWSLFWGWCWKGPYLLRTLTNMALFSTKVKSKIPK